ncbi:uncharacterized protein [Periplaneta americana]|uniref:uncharacterized protein n=1 Tax=Periplaneta americana TaxID=6978 RepID=UPI0037E90398
MLVKATSFALFAFVFTQGINVVKSEEKPLDSKVSERICAVPDQLQPLIPLASNVAKMLGDAVNDAALLKQQLVDKCNLIKENKLTSQYKALLANRLERFATNVDYVFDQIADLLKGARGVVKDFHDLAASLKA